MTDMQEWSKSARRAAVEMTHLDGPRHLAQRRAEAEGQYAPHKARVIAGGWRAAALLVALMAALALVLGVIVLAEVF